MKLRLATIIACGAALALAGGAFAQDTAPAAPAPTNSVPAAEAPAVPEPAAFGRVKDFAVPDYYEAPNQNQMKSLLRGAEAEPQPNGRVLIRELRLETYSLDGKTELVARAPECLYNSVTQTASSASRFEARSGDGKMLIEGEGFLWQQTNSTFTVSNRVHTTIQHAADLAASKP